MTYNNVISEQLDLFLRGQEQAIMEDEDKIEDPDLANDIPNGKSQHSTAISQPLLILLVICDISSITQIMIIFRNFSKSVFLQFCALQFQMLFKYNNNNNSILYKIF